jgi:hypothetical protein
VGREKSTFPAVSQLLLLRYLSVVSDVVAEERAYQVLPLPRTTFEHALGVLWRLGRVERDQLDDRLRLTDRGRRVLEDWERTWEEIGKVEEAADADEQAE